MIIEYVFLIKSKYLDFKKVKKIDYIKNKCIEFLLNKTRIKIEFKRIIR